MAIAEIAFGEDLLGKVSLVPVYAAVLDPSLGLADARIDANTVTAIALANQGSALVELLYFSRSAFFLLWGSREHRDIV